MLCSENISFSNLASFNELIKNSNNDPDINGWTPMHQVSLLNDYNTLKILLENKFPVNVTDKTGTSPIMAIFKEIPTEILSLKQGKNKDSNDHKLQSFALLLNFGAKLDYVDKNKRNVFHLLAFNDFDQQISEWLFMCVSNKIWLKYDDHNKFDFSQFSVPKEILDSKDINGKFIFYFYIFLFFYFYFFIFLFSKKKIGNTPLMLACSQGNKHLLSLLLILGADTNKVNENNQDALLYLLDNSENKKRITISRETGGIVSFKSPKKINFIYPVWINEPKTETSNNLQTEGAGNLFSFNSMKFIFIFYFFIFCFLKFFNFLIF